MGNEEKKFFETQPASRSKSSLRGRPTIRVKYDLMNNCLFMHVNVVETLQINSVS